MFIQKSNCHKCHIQYSLLDIPWNGFRGNSIRVYETQFFFVKKIMLSKE